MDFSRRLSWRGLVLGLALALSPLAHGLEPYYGVDMAKWSADQKGNADLKVLLHNVLNSFHLTHADRPDEILDHCPAQRDCVVHTPLTYEQARRVMFGQLRLIRQGRGYALPDLYCDRVVGGAEFPKGKGPGPDEIPDPTVINAEHAWPQSRFSKRFPKDLQKGDLHILFPVAAKANSLRKNFPYGNVVHEMHSVCPASKLGWTADNKNITAFMPPPTTRGDVARAAFYFSTRYRLKIDEEQEATLREWHHQDPVDDGERARNEEIFKAQMDRNPFIDHPEWVDAINDF